MKKEKSEEKSIERCCIERTAVEVEGEKKKGTLELGIETGIKRSDIKIDSLRGF